MSWKAKKARLHELANQLDRQGVEWAASQLRCILGGAESASAGRSFAKPTASEVSEYARSIGFTLDGQVFVDFYEMKGWLVGKTHMKDWRAAVRTWRHRHAKETSIRKAGFYGDLSKYKDEAL